MDDETIRGAAVRGSYLAIRCAPCRRKRQDVVDVVAAELLPSFGQGSTTIAPGDDRRRGYDRRIGPLSSPAPALWSRVD
jgi:hypothetical protein